MCQVCLGNDRIKRSHNKVSFFQIPARISLNCNVSQKRCLLVFIIIFPRCGILFIAIISFFTTGYTQMVMAWAKRHIFPYSSPFWGVTTMQFWHGPFLRESSLQFSIKAAGLLSGIRFEQTPTVRHSNGRQQTWT